MRDTQSLPADSLSAVIEASGLEMSAEPLYSAPRDIAGPPSESDQQYLVRLFPRCAPAPDLRLVFAVPLADGHAPTIREVLWWLAGDAWAVERADGDRNRWALTHGYPPNDGATARLHAHHVAQASALRALLGPTLFARMLSAYASEVRPLCGEAPLHDYIRR